MIDGPDGGIGQFMRLRQVSFYLFQSYGWLGDTYDIRVGRSRCVTGPYLDWHGNSLVEEGMGIKLAGSYQFEAVNPRVGKAKKTGSGEDFVDRGMVSHFMTHSRNIIILCIMYGMVQR